MPHYRLYFLHAFNGHIEAARDMEAAGDAEAIAAGGALVTDRPVEIWCGARKVGRCETTGPAQLELIRAERAALAWEARQTSAPSRLAQAAGDGQRVPEREREHHPAG